jgi:ribosomal-protein-alanine N-acetyltransferase
VSETRLIKMEDAAVLGVLVRESREFMAPWEPARGEGWFTAEGQAEAIRAALAEHERGGNLPHVILGPDGQVAGRITLNGIVRGAFQSCSVGYWVGTAHGGRGLATAALAHLIDVAFGELGLHRVQAETLADNMRSRRVLDRNGLTQIGMAPAYLKIAGRWQDCLLYQRINPA